MANRLVGILGAGARTARAAGLERAAHALRDAADVPFRVARIPPLAADVDGVRVRGFLRHRSFLDDVVRPGTTYRGLFLSELEPGMTVVDGGAHVGVYTLLGARGVGAAGRVLAFEPDPYNLAALVANVRAAGATNVRVVPKALAEAPRTAVFHRSRGTIGSSLVEREPDDVATTVEVTSVDVELAGEPLASLLVKLNVEGAEPLVLEGMRETLARCDRVSLFVEVNPAVLDRPDELVRTLFDLGFDVFWIDRPTQSLSPVDLSRPLPKGHLLARRG